MRVGIGAGLLLAVLILFAATNACAQNKTFDQEYAERIKATQVFNVLGDNLFGEEINEYTGGINFSVTDINLPGNNNLPVNISRKYTAYSREVNAPSAPWVIQFNGMFGDWDLDIPHLSGIYGNKYGMNAMTSNTSGIRCNVNSLNEANPPGIDGFSPAEYWHGYNLQIPNQGQQELLYFTGTDKPGDSLDYRWVTKNRWYFSCLPTTSNNVVGDAYLARSPDGTKYWFNHIIQRPTEWISKSFTVRVYDWATGTYIDQVQTIGIHRVEVITLPTRIEDRFGNWVTYTYDTIKPQQLLQISASDGRNIILTYNVNGRVATVSDGSRVWNYTYNGSGIQSTLNKVVLPDSTSWNYDFSQLNTRHSITNNPRASTCGAPGTIYSQPLTAVITHPSGAIGTFIFKNMWHGRSYVVRRCDDVVANGQFIGSIGVQPVFFSVLSLQNKQISGTTLAQSKVWNWTYPSLSFSYSTQCPGTYCNPTKIIKVSQPDGNTLQKTYGTRYGVDEGLLLKTEVVATNGSIMSSTVSDYLTNATGQAYPAAIGVSPQTYTEPNEASPKPMFKNQINELGVNYINQVNSFDSFARPTSTTRSNSNGYSKSEQTTYSDNLNKWVLGQVKTVTDTGSGLVEQSNSYDATTANVLSKTSFGVLQESYTYYTDGTLATVKNGNNKTYTLTSWKRGIPQSIKDPNLKIQTGVVNDSGWLTSVTNQLGNTSNYTYDSMGRLASIAPPTGEGWAGTTLTFTPLTVTTFGVPAGGWKHTVSRGDYRKETYMDALYRPLVVREYDNTNITGTQRFSLKSYDTLNREVFSSYPGTSSGITVGARTTYDALGRVIENKADSEIGVLTTTTQYLIGGGIKVTGPDGNITTRTFRSLDAPSYDQMITEVAPGGVTTSISRDGFGKPLTISRSGSDGLNLSKKFAYDSAQRVCMRTEPETGTSIIDYDAAGNVLWAANGQTVANVTVCDRTGVVAAAKINYTYDALNRITKTDVYDPNIPDPTVTYLDDGSVSTLVNGTAKWTYTYNKLGKPVTEKLTLGTTNSTITHAYDTLANESSLTYPSGTNVAYLPNPLGQPTKAGTYATAMTYRASGFLTGFTYGNAATYSAKPNLRGLPARRLDMKGTTVISDELMAYDQNANPACVRDSTTGNPGSRDFTYDARNRLIKASAPNQAWVSSEYQYDSQDNIKMARLADRQYNYSYNALNRLVEIAQPGTPPVSTNYGLLSCADYALLADVDNTTVVGSGGASSISISPSSMPAGTVSTIYSTQTLSASSGIAPYTYMLNSGSLPPGLSLSGTQISGTPSSEGSYTFTIKATDSVGNYGTKAYTVTINSQSGTTLTISPSSMPAGTVSTIYSTQTLSASSGVAPYSYVLNSGSLPPGLSLSGTQISGTPSSAGSYNFTIKATDSVGNYGTKAYAVTINPVSGTTITINPSAMPDGEQDFYFSQTLTSSGGTGPYTYAITVGSLPLGLSLSGSNISGTPSKVQTKTFTIQSTDSLGNTGSKGYSITIIGSGGGGCGTCLLQSVQPMLLTGDTSKYDFTYDANGRMLTKGTLQSYVYDALNRMTQVTGKETYLYDGHGRRVQVTKTSDTLKNYPIYSLDGKLLVEDNRQTLKRTEYIYAGGRLVAKKEQPINPDGTNNGTIITTTYIHTDFVGSPVAETDGITGAVTKVERFKPYGETEDMQLDDGPGFTGHVTDVLTGLTYMQQRYYDAEIGRFISPDPIGPEEDFINHFNRYNYAQNNPVRYTDPDGRDTVGENIDQKAMAAAVRGDNGETYGWAFAATAWKYLGAEGVSQVADKGMVANTGDKVGAGLEILGVIPAVKFLGVAGKEVTLVIGKLSDLGNLREGEKTLINLMPDLKSVNANWIQNSSVLRDSMRLGTPIRDASVNAKGELINNTGFLRAERNVLENKGWTYNEKTTMWYPPKK